MARHRPDVTKPHYFTAAQYGVSGLLPNWVRLAPNGTNLGLFKISFSTFCTETDLKKSQICPIWGPI